MKHMQNPGLKIGPPLIWLWLLEVHVCWVLKLDTWVFPSVYTIECREVIHTQRYGPISFRHVSLWGWIFDLHRTTYQSNLGVTLRKRATSYPCNLYPWRPTRGWCFIAPTKMEVEEKIINCDLEPKYSYLDPNQNRNWDANPYISTVRLN